MTRELSDRSPCLHVDATVTVAVGLLDIASDMKRVAVQASTGWGLVSLGIPRFGKYRCLGGPVSVWKGKGMMEPMVPALYIDPGIGFLSLQALAGVFVGASFYFRRTLRRVLGRLSLRPGSREDQIPPQSPASDDDDA